MPKVLRVINRLNLGGPTYNAAYLSKYLGEDYETLLVAGEKEKHLYQAFYLICQKTPFLAYATFLLLKTAPF